MPLTIVKNCKTSLWANGADTKPRHCGLKYCETKNKLIGGIRPRICYHQNAAALWRFARVSNRVARCKGAQHDAETKYGQLEGGGH